MSKATSDPGTPIFGEVNSELELPEIDVHDFEWHEFDFPEGPSATRPPEADESEGEPNQAAAPTTTPTETASEMASDESGQGTRQVEDRAGEAEPAANEQGFWNDPAEEASRQWAAGPVEAEEQANATTRSEERTVRRSRADVTEAIQESDGDDSQQGGQSNNAAAEAVAGAAAAAQRGGRRRKED